MDRDITFPGGIHQLLELVWQQGPPFMADILLGVEPLHTLQRVILHSLGNHPIAEAINSLDVMVIGAEANLLGGESLLEHLLYRINVDIGSRLHPCVADDSAHPRHDELHMFGGSLLEALLERGEVLLDWCASAVPCPFLLWVDQPIPTHPRPFFELGCLGLSFSFVGVALRCPAVAQIVEILNPPVGNFFASVTFAFVDGRHRSFSYDAILRLASPEGNLLQSIAQVLHASIECCHENELALSIHQNSVVARPSAWIPASARQLGLLIKVQLV